MENSIHSLTPSLSIGLASKTSPFAIPQKSLQGAGQELKQAFHQFVGETFFQMMLKSLRSSQQRPAYFHGGQAEDIFQEHLDQEMTSQLAGTSGGEFTNDLYQLFVLQLNHTRKAEAISSTQTSFEI